ncbi:MAG TPA: hypothetical protein VGL47_14485 [Amycolatopsis sp.]|uniref:hypothetical protein n=1 Tax=Amycolatopsis sp. TaxID=37632 RepID=UPI002F3EC3D4
MTVHVEVPNLVAARRALAFDERTSGLTIQSTGGAERKIVVTNEVDDAGTASSAAIALIRDVLGETLSGDVWVESVETTPSQ